MTGEFLVYKPTASEGSTTRRRPVITNVRSEEALMAVESEKKSLLQLPV